MGNDFIICLVYHSLICIYYFYTNLFEIVYDTEEKISLPQHFYLSTSFNGLNPNINGRERLDLHKVLNHFLIAIFFGLAKSFGRSLI